MSIHGYKHVRRMNDGRPKPYFGRIWVLGELMQVGGFATAEEAHAAAVALRVQKTLEAAE